MDGNKYLEKLNYELNASNNKDELLLAISYAERLVRYNLPIIFDKKHLSKILNINEFQLNYILKELEKKILP